MTEAPLLIAVLRDPARLARLDLSEWDLLLRQSSAANLMLALHWQVTDRGLLASIPDRPRAHLEWVHVIGERHGKAVLFEVTQIARALEETGLPLLLLKGAAYRMAGLSASRGRLFTDVDILVPKARVDEVEAALMLSGWTVTGLDEYDQRYYRSWMHELPPMRHSLRGNSIDVHHAILPQTARVHPDPDRLRAAALPVAGQPGLYVLAPRDMVLHSAVHLFYDGEFDKGLRDLFDIHQLLSEFGAEHEFWDGLSIRARELSLARPLFYALRYSARLLGTAIPPTVMADVATARPNRLLMTLMDMLLLRALMPDHESCADRWTPLARFALYVRGNWLRMPPLLLMRHLFHKAFVSGRK